MPEQYKGKRKNTMIKYPDEMNRNGNNTHPQTKERGKERENWKEGFLNVLLVNPHSRSMGATSEHEEKCMLSSELVKANSPNSGKETAYLSSQ
jgi:hypothetical protein